MNQPVNEFAQEASIEKLNVLIIGNNPIDLSHLFEKLNEDKNRNVFTMTAFDLKTVNERLTKFQPDYILIDDNIGKNELRIIMNSLQSDHKIKNIPITVLKNSNYDEFIHRGILSYILKDSVTIESLYLELENTLRLQKTQAYIYEAYRKRKGQLLRILKLKRDPAF